MMAVGTPVGASLKPISACSDTRPSCPTPSNAVRPTSPRTVRPTESAPRPNEKQSVEDIDRLVDKQISEKLLEMQARRKPLRNLKDAIHQLKKINEEQDTILDEINLMNSQGKAGRQLLERFDRVRKRVITVESIIDHFKCLQKLCEKVGDDNRFEIGLLGFSEHCDLRVAAENGISLINSVIIYDSVKKTRQTMHLKDSLVNVERKVNQKVENYWDNVEIQKRGLFEIEYDVRNPLERASYSKKYFFGQEIKNFDEFERVPLNQSIAQMHDGNTPMERCLSRIKQQQDAVEITKKLTVKQKRGNIRGFTDVIKEFSPTAIQVFETALVKVNDHTVFSEGEKEVKHYINLLTDFTLREAQKRATLQLNNNRAAFGASFSGMSTDTAFEIKEGRIYTSDVFNPQGNPLIDNIVDQLSLEEGSNKIPFTKIVADKEKNAAVVIALDNIANEYDWFKPWSAEEDQSESAFRKKVEKENPVMLPERGYFSPTFGKFLQQKLYELCETPNDAQKELTTPEEIERKCEEQYAENGQLSDLTAWPEFKSTTTYKRIADEWNNQHPKESHVEWKDIVKGLLTCVFKTRRAIDVSGACCFTCSGISSCDACKNKEENRHLIKKNPSSVEVSDPKPVESSGLVKGISTKLDESNYITETSRVVDELKVNLPLFFKGIETKYQLEPMPEDIIQKNVDDNCDTIKEVWQGNPGFPIYNSIAYALNFLIYFKNQGMDSDDVQQYATKILTPLVESLNTLFEFDQSEAGKNLSGELRYRFANIVAKADFFTGKSATLTEKIPAIKESLEFDEHYKELFDDEEAYNEPKVTAPHYLEDGSDFWKKVVEIAAPRKYFLLSGFLGRGKSQFLSSSDFKDMWHDDDGSVVIDEDSRIFNRSDNDGILKFDGTKKHDINKFSLFSRGDFLTKFKEKFPSVIVKTAIKTESTDTVDGSAVTGGCICCTAAKQHISNNMQQSQGAKKAKHRHTTSETSGGIPGDEVKQQFIKDAFGNFFWGGNMYVANTADGVWTEISEMISSEEESFRTNYLPSDDELEKISCEIESPDYQTEEGLLAVRKTLKEKLEKTLRELNVFTQAGRRDVSELKRQIDALINKEPFELNEVLSELSNIKAKFLDILSHKDEQTFVEKIKAFWSIKHKIDQLGTVAVYFKHLVSVDKIFINKHELLTDEDVNMEEFQKALESLHEKVQKIKREHALRVSQINAKKDGLKITSPSSTEQVSHFKPHIELICTVGPDEKEEENELELMGVSKAILDLTECTDPEKEEVIKYLQAHMSSTSDAPVERVKGDFKLGSLEDELAPLRRLEISLGISNIYQLDSDGRPTLEERYRKKPGKLGEIVADSRTNRGNETFNPNKLILGQLGASGSRSPRTVLDFASVDDEKNARVHELATSLLDKCKFNHINYDNLQYFISKLESFKKDQETKIMYDLIMNYAKENWKDMTDKKGQQQQLDSHELRVWYFKKEIGTACQGCGKCEKDHRLTRLQKHIENKGFVYDLEKLKKFCGDIEDIDFFVKAQPYALQVFGDEINAKAEDLEEAVKCINPSLLEEDDSDLRV